jgi:imidazole glycerol-phosphate synthase subunit HisF
MLRTRVIPALLLRDESLVKTVRFGKFSYVGDPCNTVRIFNELEVDELMLLDISATRHGREPNFALLADIANECFMPVAYGGGIASVEHAKTILKIGFEKVVINSAALDRPALVRELSAELGSQAVVASIDVKRNLLGHYQVYRHAAGRPAGLEPVDWALRLQDEGAGELLLTSVDREGTWEGLDIDLVRSVSGKLRIPLIAHGGAAAVSSLVEGVKQGGASAVAVGSMVVFQKKGMGVLVNFPSPGELESALGAAAS